MLHRLTVLITLPVLAVLFGFSAQPVQAFASVSAYSAGCSSFSASGTSNSPYVILWVEQASGLPEYAVAVAVNNGTYSGSISFPVFPEGTEVDYYVWGSPTTDISDWDNEEYFVETLACQDGFSGPPIPAGFVLRTITCDVAVFDAPGGSPVGANRIRGGQTWYVNPKPASAPDGSSWTEIFVSGYNNVYIPTRCVG
jgi:hypothetical protein